ncbi:GatB/YqeY domain-containing protein [Microlunatus speluncae]|uniref:GatB/YqeY domain-containing protein n=1 Tax=Microlunatus speluncae TaxID=2594267 RepID=UPI0012667579|nr:GatB/YqeY domain-containing protein [Microlunatus speluncae]
MTDLRARLQTALREALKGRDQDATRAIRSALSAIANAEAVEVTTTRTEARPVATAETVAGTVAGPGTAEVARKELTGDDLDSIVAGEITDRRAAAERYRESGRGEPADLLRQEADLLERILRGD